MTALNYDELDPGIREVVRFLNEAGFTTTDSGDGVTKPPDEDCVIPVPNVHIPVPATVAVAESHKVMQLLEGCGVMFDPTHPDDPEPSIQLTYSPTDETAIVSVYGLNDSLLEEAQLREWTKKPELPRDHIDADGKFQSDKYVWSRADFVPLKVTDPMAQPALWEYARQRRSVDPGFADDLQHRLLELGYSPT